MARRRRILSGILLLELLGILSCASAQESPNASFSVSASASDSGSVGNDYFDINNQSPCSFRGTFLLHKQSTRLDPCTICTCFNGTTTCNIESCPSKAGCEAFEIVIIPEECCPQCPYKMFLRETTNLYDQTFNFTEDESKSVKLNLDIAVHRKLTSRTVRGENLWKLSVWVSPNEDGSGKKYSYEDNIFDDKDAAQEYSRPNYPPWVWNKLKYTMKFRGGTCVDYKYFCIRFGQADDPRPTYELSFTFQPVDNEEFRLIDCVPLGKCKVDINNQNPCSFRGTFLIHEQSTRLDPCTICTCFNGTTTCNIESCPSEAGCEAFEIVIIPEECCPQCPYKMFLEETKNLYDQIFNFTEDDNRSVKFNLDIAVDRTLTSRTVRGENLWKLSAWVSPNEDGSGKKYSYEDNIFDDKDAAQEYSKPNYPPWVWNKLKYTMKFRGGTCVDYKYFCVRFGQADDPRPTYELSFTFQPVDNEEFRLIDCVPLGKCKDLDTPSVVTIDANGTTTVVLPPEITEEVTGYKVEYRVVNTTIWSVEEYRNTEQNQLTGPFDEGYTYELRISFKYDDTYGDSHIFETFTIPCRTMRRPCFRGRNRKWNEKWIMTFDVYSVPYIDTKLNLSSSSGRKGIANVIAKWSFRNLTRPCSVTNQYISVKQMDLDNCTVPRHLTNLVKTLSEDKRSHRVPKTRANTAYNVSLSVNTRFKPYNMWKVIRTFETAPSSPPTGIFASSNPRARRLEIRWNKPPCGKRNSRMQSYKVEMENSRGIKIHTFKGTRARYAGFTKGEAYIVRVAATNSHGTGPYSSKFKGRFGVN